MTSLQDRFLVAAVHLVIFVLIFQPSLALAGPEGGQVAAGQASIEKSGADTSIRQSSDRAVINWNSFDIGKGETVDHRMPGPDSAGLHRVVGGGGASQLEGALKSNGNVFLVNPKGAVIHNGARIDTKGFVATTSDIKNEDFMAGNLDFGIKGSPGAAIVNKGEISVKENGYAALVAPQVRNEGIIAGRLSSVALASTGRFKLDVYGDDLISFAVDDETAGGFYDTSGEQLGAENVGRIENEGGIVLLTAKQLDQTVAGTVNNSGLIEAGSAELDGGKIVLRGIGERVKVANKGTISASSVKADGGVVRVVGEDAVEVSGSIEAKGGQKGGAVDISGKKETSLAAAIISAEGPEGGLVRLGGSFQGGKIKSNLSDDYYKDNFLSAGALADNLYSTLVLNIDRSSVISSGVNGTAIAWSDGAANIDGIIKGKYVETSGKQLNITSPPVIFENGSWLIDPEDVIISDQCSGDITSTCINSNLLSNLASNIEILADDSIKILTNLNFTSNSWLFRLYSGNEIVINDNITIHGANKYIEIQTKELNIGSYFYIESYSIEIRALNINIEENAYISSRDSIEFYPFDYDQRYEMKLSGIEKISIGLNSILKSEDVRIWAKDVIIPGLTIISDLVLDRWQYLWAMAYLNGGVTFMNTELLSGHLKAENSDILFTGLGEENIYIKSEDDPSTSLKLEGGLSDNPVVEARDIFLNNVNLFLDAYSLKVNNIWYDDKSAISGTVTTDDAPHIFNVDNWVPDYSYSYSTRLVNPIRYVNKDCNVSYPNWPFYSARIQFKDGTVKGGSSELQRKEQMTLYMYYFLKDRIPTYDYSGKNYDIVLEDYSNYIKMLVDIDIDTLGDTGLDSLLTPNAILDTILAAMKSQYDENYQLALSDSDINLFEKGAYMLAYINGAGKHFTYDNNFSDLQIAYNEAKNYLLEKKSLNDILTKLLVLEPTYNGPLDAVGSYYPYLHQEMVSVIKAYNGHDHGNDTDANIKAAYDWSSGLMLTFIRQWLPASQVPTGIEGLVSAYNGALAAKAAWEASQKNDEKPIDEEPIDEKPIDEKPIDEKPIDEKPIDEKPIDEKPIDEKPID
ncbi:MAG: filamentous hemagglutinin N-terminal domain-containing protein, partial [Deltaproteobacteria bacterium]|nr:filamentous hemagglutinin N-terminal domain-containing protein [Deltaproteobacteria bacterium]